MITEDEIRECALHCISITQYGCDIYDNDVRQRYSVAFNDGVIALLKEIIEKIHKKEEVVNE